MKAVDTVRQIVEERDAGAVPLWQHPEWAARFPWLVQGTTGCGDDRSFDLGLSGTQPVGAVLGRWRALLDVLGIPCAVHARQVHGSQLSLHHQRSAPGLLLMSGVDGHATAAPNILLTVSVADCVPISLVEPHRRVVALLHAGWRGVAAGILEQGMQRLQREFGVAASDCWMHSGPAICERCYEVGPEVHRQLQPLVEPPDSPRPIDLRGILLERALRLGLPLEHCSLSRHCTRCGDADGERAFFSHRAGEPGRQMGLLAVRPMHRDAYPKGAAAS